MIDINFGQIVITMVAAGFSLWAGVVAWGVKRVTHQIDRISDDLKTETKALNDYARQTNERLARLEMVFDAIKIRRSDIDGNMLMSRSVANNLDRRQPDVAGGS